MAKRLYRHRLSGAVREIEEVVAAGSGGMWEPTDLPVRCDDYRLDEPPVESSEKGFVKLTAPLEPKPVPQAKRKGGGK